nr:hypothetical protein [uncultured Lichenicoccus sp.]
MRCRLANRACLQWFDRPIESILGSHLRDMRGETQRFERTIRLTDGRTLHADRLHTGF